MSPRRPDCPPWCTADHSGAFKDLHRRDVWSGVDGAAEVGVSLMWDRKPGPQAVPGPGVMIFFSNHTGPTSLLSTDVMLLERHDAERLSKLIGLLGHKRPARALADAAALIAGGRS